MALLREETKMINRKFYLSIDFWLYLIIFITSVKPALIINLDSFDWYVETAFTLLGLIGMIYTVFFKKTPNNNQK